MNVKRVHRLWVLEGLMVPKTRKHRGKMALGGEANSAWALPAVRPDDVWSYDFVAAPAADGAPLRILNIVDEFTREAVASHVTRSIGARDITRVLDTVFATRGKPAIIRSDNCREFIAAAAAVVAWLADHHVTVAFIAKASPQQTATSNPSTAPCATSCSTARYLPRCLARESSSPSESSDTTFPDRTELRA